MKKLSDFKKIHKYMSHYQVVFDKIVGLVTDTFSST